MPLDKSGSKSSVGRNIKTEQAAGKPHKQAIAIALDVARRAKGGSGKSGPPVPPKGHSKTKREYDPAENESAPPGRASSINPQDLTNPPEPEIVWAKKRNHPGKAQ